MDDKPSSIPLADELARRGIRPSRRLGQNFMVDRNMLDFLVRTADVSSADLVVEVGAGAGFLTERLCAAAGHVISVEIDAGLYALAAERLSGFANLTLIHSDALSGDRQWSPPVCEAIEAQTSARPDSPLKLVANLPYSIATAVVQVILESSLAWSGLWFTCQWEVAGRLTAGPGGDDYGFISVLAALLADVRVVRKLPPSVFWPRPKIDSAVVEVLPNPAKREAAGDLDALRRTVGALFTQRRKQVKAALKTLALDSDGILRVERVLQIHGLRPDERVFRLAPPVLRDIASALSHVRP